MTINARQTVREISIENPGAVAVFESLGIDYCCGGGQPLEDACAARNVAAGEVIELLEAASRTAESRPAASWSEVPLTELVEHIVREHHEFVKRESPRLVGLLKKTIDAHGTSHPELMTVNTAFRALAAELDTHMFKEERVLFPYVESLAAADRDGRPLRRPPFLTAANPIRMMLAEHDGAGELLRSIRAATDDFVVPPGGCPTYTALYRGLEAFERDLHVHIHLENNILFPRALEIEGRMLGAGNVC
jgi:regulator of cell morphogenesis and NO signaling